MFKKLNLRIALPVFLLLSIQMIPSAVYAQDRHDFVVADPGLRASVNIDELGCIHIVWWGNGIGYRRFDSAGTPTTETKSIIADVGARFPAIAMTSDCGLIAWETFTAFFNSYIDAQLVNPDGDRLSADIRVDDGYGDAYRSTPIALPLDDTTFFVAWSGQGFATQRSYGIYGRVVTKTSHAVGECKLLSPQDQSGNNSRPIIAAHPSSDHLVLLWQNTLNASYSGYVRRLARNGDPVDSTATQIGSNLFLNTWSPSITMFSDGSYIVVWSGQTLDSAWNIYLDRFNKDGLQVGSIQKVSASKCSEYAEARITSEAGGKCVVVWEGDISTRPRIVGQRFLLDGAVSGSNVTLSWGPDSMSHYFPEIYLRDGRICVVWIAMWKTGYQVQGMTSTFDKLSNVVSAEEIIEPKSFALNQNYPNPFNPSTTISFDLPGSAFVTLKVYDVLGREVARLVNETKTPGGHSVKWDASDIPSGIYFARLEAGGKVLTRKMCLVK